MCRSKTSFPPDHLSHPHKIIKNIEEKVFNQRSQWMDIRRFESHNLQEAIQLVKAELGKDALIISTREKEVYSEELKKNCRLYEVTALPNTSTQSLAPLKSMSVSEPPAQQNTELELLRSELMRVRREVELLPQLDVMDHMQEIKVLLHEIMREKFNQESQTENLEIIDIAVKLRTAGVYEGFIAQLTAWLKSIDEEKDLLTPEMRKNFYLDAAIQFIFSHLKISDPFVNEYNTQKIICLVGPTGVGKTTTIAKMAAQLKRKEAKKIEMISLDSFRIAAANQLRTYANILEIPFSELSSHEEIAHAIAKENAADVIFIDTAGRNVRLPEQIESLKKIAQLPFPVEFHLVLSSSMKQRDIDETTRAFKFLSLSSVIFTKLDESWAFGEILNTSLQNKVPLSYFTTGQNVPDDIEWASKERVVERLLKL